MEPPAPLPPAPAPPPPEPVDPLEPAVSPEPPDPPEPADPGDPPALDVAPVLEPLEAPPLLDDVIAPLAPEVDGAALSL